jgi:hypothetical protein
MHPQPRSAGESAMRGEVTLAIVRNHARISDE